MKLVFLTITVLLSVLNIQFAKSEQEIGQVTMELEHHEREFDASAGSSGSAIIKLSEKIRTHIKSEVEDVEDVEDVEAVEDAEVEQRLDEVEEADMSEGGGHHHHAKAASTHAHHHKK